MIPVNTSPVETAGPEPATEPSSKTRRKRAAHDVQALGEELLQLPADRLDALDLPERLRDALEAARPIRSHEARRRQLQYIGKLMRAIDIGPIREAVAAVQLGHAHDALALHRAERWRAELIDDDAVTTRFVAAHPEVDLRRLRSLVRGARQDAALTPEQRNGRAYRELFRLIRDEGGSDV